LRLDGILKRLNDGQINSTGQTEGSKIGFWGAFESSEMEEAYREHHRRRKTLQAFVAVAFGMVISLLYIPTDYRLLGTAPERQVLLAARIAFAVVSVVVLVLLRRGLRPTTMDRMLLVWMLLGSALTLLIGSTRVSIHFLGYAFTVIIELFLIYIVVPVRLPFQAGVALCTAIGDAILLFFGGVQIDSVSRRTIIAGYGLANLMGAFSSWSLHHLKREQYAALKRESVLRSGLETAIAEIRTLEGIVPICAHCKSIRNDEGYWQQVEVYVRDNTHAEFSHGICPTCAQKHYGDLLKARQEGPAA